MELLHLAIDFIKHLNDPAYLQTIVLANGNVFYTIFFLIIFIETGLIVMPLLPGDSLLFTIGALTASTHVFSLTIVIPLLIMAALLGDNVNYFVGRFFEIEISKRERILFFKREYLTQTHEFYEKHGGKTVIMARFVPIVRTVAPFVAGAGSMNYGRYILFCIAGAVLWVCGVTSLGYVFGNIEVVRKHIDLVLIGIIFVSVLPIIFQYFKSKNDR